jgi:hypothetical protein
MSRTPRPFSRPLDRPGHRRAGLEQRGAPILGSLALLTLLSCSAPPPAEDPGAGAGSGAAAATAAEDAHAGHYLLGDLGSSFQPCGSSLKFVVVGYYPAVAQLQMEYEKTKTADKEPIFVRLRGTIQEKEKVGAARRFDGTFDLLEVLEVRPRGENDCP